MALTIQVVGHKKTGKTLVTAGLIKRLTRAGLSVAAITTPTTATLTNPAPTAIAFTKPGPTRWSSSHAKGVFNAPALPSHSPTSWTSFSKRPT